ncbi:methyltransferase [Streptomyces sp. NBC_00654]|uniref:methyltransferase domain-containing protein n=1 Tax=Streptomyces sp. NBC_00654 TaxID=2975799 RepID=UPI002251BF43|nr:methyltransferase domain-containing protein [Streptomyces sp. NBC_00654]MCX4967147.1 methyltransferase [Streptomyces sp. NBC_00654]
MNTQGLLAEIAEQLGHPVSDKLAVALREVPRHRFLPETVWVRDGQGGYRPIDRAADPGEWMAAAYEDQTLVTQFSDGLPSSSASMPSMVLRMLQLANVAPPGWTQQQPFKVVEFGTGTGFNAALLCALLGQGRVTTVELDPVLAEQGERNLEATGYAPAVVVGDAGKGWPDSAPYALVLSTFSVDQVPPAWLAQTIPGGRIVTPWTSSWCCYGTLALTISASGTAEGRFHDFASFMPMRPSIEETTPHGDHGQAAPILEVRSVTEVSPWAVAGGDLDAEFHLGLTVTGAFFSWDTTGEHVPVRLRVGDTTSTSWATVDFDGIHTTEFTVTQAGPRQLWTEIAVAYRTWESNGRPGVGRHGLTVHSDGGHTLWLDSPDHPLT